MEMILEVQDINKYFGKKHILKNVSFDLREGEILGFIGPNGAGKTTTIKLILGLQRINSGHVILNGYDIEKNFEKAIKSVGAIVESPDLYMYLSGKKNLEMIASMYEGISEERINEVVKLVGLEGRIKDKVSKYSLGMRQRLGIAAAILHHPKVLILDEPTNGLDPEGIKEVRDLLKELAKKEKMGVLISSHNLSELENIVTDVCLIQNGEILSVNSIKDIKKKGSKTSYKIKLNKVTGLDKVLKDYKYEIKDDSVSIQCDEDEVPVIIDLLVSKKYKILMVTEDTVSLEDAFLKKTGGNIID